MLLPKCFICDTKTIIYCENVFTIQSCHTDTPVINILKKFAKELELTTFLPKNRYGSTVICQACMIKINEYDLACMTAKKMENQLKDLLQKKEEIDDSKSDSDYNPDGLSGDEGDGKHNHKGGSKGVEVSVMRCNVCNINFKSYSELTTHTHQPKKIKGLIIKRINKDGQTRIMEHFTDISPSPAIKTMKNSSPTIKSKKIKKRNFSCSQCECSFYKRQELRDHVKEAHTTEDANRCPICRGLYPDKEVLEKHIPLHEGKHRLQCVECNTVFTRSNGLMRHMSIHTGEKFHICDTCGKEFIYQSSFKRHLLVHGNIRNHSCAVCDKSFVQTTHLKVHMRSHSKEKPYKCPLCERLFTYRYTMLAHYKSHPGVAMEDVLTKKSHTCSLCDMSFPQRRKLDDHYVSAHDAIIDGTGRSNLSEVTENVAVY
ncbi:zinc finger protein OZF-like [Bradysia coprophila]|uniref:zinc finger protein OZF-like n=1 Tax=Bradysia coprophila TaxID=38358 RepID=UPI00187D9274|nr:zinc finger protein OZF-like [Bradysia coprophila]